MEDNQKNEQLKLHKYTTSRKENWLHYLGAYFVKEKGALSFIVSEAHYISHYLINDIYQQVDMIVIFADKIMLVEAKTTDAKRRVSVPFSQIKGYWRIKRALEIPCSIWAFARFRSDNTIIGAEVSIEENGNFFRTDEGNFFSQGLNPANRISKEVDFIQKYEDILAVISKHLAKNSAKSHLAFLNEFNKKIKVNKA